MKNYSGSSQWDFHKYKEAQHVAKFYIVQIYIKICNVSGHNVSRQQLRGLMRSLTNNVMNP